jgi:hypothetical protein
MNLFPAGDVRALLILGWALSSLAMIQLRVRHKPFKQSKLVTSFVPTLIYIKPGRLVRTYGTKRQKTTQPTKALPTATNRRERVRILL